VRRLRLLKAFCLLTGVLLLPNCGRKTTPVPPEAAIPAPIGDLKVGVDPEGLTLHWSWPQKTEKGAALRRVSEFVVERAENPADGFCADCPLRYQTVASLEGGPLPERPETAILSYRDQNLRAGYHYSYRVSSSLGWRVISAPSTPVGLVWQVPLAPPVALVGTNGVQEVSLSWLPPERDRDGQMVAGALLYQVERSEAGQTFRSVCGNLTTPAFTDQGLRSGINYQYRVRAARVSGGTGEYSAPLAVTLADTTPPPVPFGLSAVITRESVRLFWEPLSGEDLGGFMIYRRRQLPTGSTELELIGQVEGRITTFIDPLPLPEDDEVRHYALKSFDRAEPPNLSEYSRDAQTTAKSRQP
jgi:hypothetical protein